MTKANNTRNVARAIIRASKVSAASAGPLSRASSARPAMSSGYETVGTSAGSQTPAETTPVAANLTMAATSAAALTAEKQTMNHHATRTWGRCQRTPTARATAPNATTATRTAQEANGGKNRVLNKSSASTARYVHSAAIQPRHLRSTPAPVPEGAIAGRGVR